MEKIYGMHKLVGLQLFWSRTPNFSSGTPIFCQMGVLNSCFQNPSESSGTGYKDSSSRILFYLSLVLVQPRKTRPCLTERLLMGLKESNQTNKQNQESCNIKWQKRWEAGATGRQLFDLRPSVNVQTVPVQSTKTQRLVSELRTGYCRLNENRLVCKIH